MKRGGGLAPPPSSPPRSTLATHTRSNESGAHTRMTSSIRHACTLHSAATGGSGVRARRDGAHTGAASGSWEVGDPLRPHRRPPPPPTPSHPRHTRPGKGHLHQPERGTQQNTHARGRRGESACGGCAAGARRGRAGRGRSPPAAPRVPPPPRAHPPRRIPLNETTHPQHAACQQQGFAAAPHPRLPGPPPPPSRTLLPGGGLGGWVGCGRRGPSTTPCNPQPFMPCCLSQRAVSACKAECGAAPSPAACHTAWSGVPSMRARTESLGHCATTQGCRPGGRPERTRSTTRVPPPAVAGRKHCAPPRPGPRGSPAPTHPPTHPTRQLR